MFDNYGNHHVPQPAQPPPPQKVVRFDKKYVTKMPGILKLIQLACNFIGFICIKIDWGVWISSVFYNILYWVCIIMSSLFLLAYTFHLVEKYERWPWLKVELFYCSAVCLAYIVLSILATCIGESVGYAVGFFGFCAFIAYAFDGFLKYKAWKRGLPAQ